MKNKMNKKIILAVLLIILGIYFFGKGITGLVISQSCCFGSDCEQENLCEAATETFSTPWASYFFIIFGIGLIAVAIGSYFRNKDSFEV